MYQQEVLCKLHLLCTREFPYIYVGTRGMHMQLVCAMIIIAALS